MRLSMNSLHSERYIAPPKEGRESCAEAIRRHNLIVGQEVKRDWEVGAKTWWGKKGKRKRAE